VFLGTAKQNRPTHDLAHSGTADALNESQIRDAVEAILFPASADVSFPSRPIFDGLRKMQR
jgi:hypothetical protein